MGSWIASVSPTALFAQVAGTASTCTTKGHLSWVGFRHNEGVAFQSGTDSAAPRREESASESSDKRDIGHLNLLFVTAPESSSQNRRHRPKRFVASRRHHQGTFCEHSPFSVSFDPVQVAPSVGS